MKNITVIISAKIGQQIVDRLWEDLLDNTGYTYAKIHSINEELLSNLREGVRFPITNSMFSNAFDVNEEN